MASNLNLPEAFKADFIRLWAGNLTRAEISGILEKKHGIRLTTLQLSQQAKHTGAIRGIPGSNQAMLQERMHQMSLARWGAARRADNPVKPVEPGTFKAPPTGFRLGGGVP